MGGGEELGAVESEEVSWLELDDRILEHPKFIRAVNMAGAETVFLWLGIRAYCGQNLSNGHVPADMVGEVRGPKNPSKREAALEALIAVNLIERRDDGIQMHDYLDWSSSREEVLDRRDRARERKARSRRDEECDDDCDEPSDDERDSAVTIASVTALPSPSSSTPNQKRDPVREVFDCWREIHGHPNARLDAKRKGKIKARLAEKFSPEALCEAIRNAKNDGFLMGQNPGARVYDGIETLLRDAAQVERLEALKSPNGQAETGSMKWAE
jgi:hypothetical protein